MSRCVSDSFVLGAIGLYLALCPYTKVEESFGMQAAHDLLTLGPHMHTEQALAAFDHLEFPGVVPRTFVGPIIISAMAWPLHALSEVARRASIHDATASQLFVRAALGLLFWLSYRAMRTAVAERFSKRVGSLFGWLTFAQFHLLFYCSRTLPNSFALAVTTLAFSLWLKGRTTAALCGVAIAMVLFRCDMVLLLAPMVLAALLSGEVKLVPIAVRGVAVSLAALGLSVSVDSYFWRRWVYPEGEVLFFNTVENRSAEWGVSPWHWYAANALPKGLLLSFPLLLLGLAGVTLPASLCREEEREEDPKPSLLRRLGDMITSSFAWSKTASPAACRRHRELLYYCAPAVAFVALYSYLPHKELRFLFPAMPLLTLAAALEADLLLPPTTTTSSTATATSVTNPTIGNDMAVEACPFMKRDAAAVAKNMPNPHLAKTPISNGSAAFRIVSKLYTVAFYGAYLTSLLPICFFLSASYRNYPGGAAMARLNADIERSLRSRGAIRTRSDANGLWDCINATDASSFEPVRVHIDVLACVSGVTRYLELRGLPLCSTSVTSAPVPLVRYSKDESVTTADQLLTYDYVITTPHMYSYGTRLCEATAPSTCKEASPDAVSAALSPHFEVVSGAFVYGFRRFSLQLSELRRGRWPVAAVTSPELAVLKKKTN